MRRMHWTTKSWRHYETLEFWLPRKVKERADESPREVPRSTSYSSQMRTRVSSAYPRTILLSYPHAARNYRPPQSQSTYQPTKASLTHDSDAESQVDLGWKQPESKLPKQKSKRSASGNQAADAQDINERKQAAAV